MCLVLPTETTNQLKIMAPLYRVRAALSLNEKLRPIADSLLPDKDNMNKCTVEEWDKFISFLKTLDLMQLHTFKTEILEGKNSPYLEWRGNSCHTFHSTECDYLVEYTIAFQYYLQTTLDHIELRYQNEKTICSKLFKQIPILTFRIKKTLGDCKFVLSLMKHKPKFQQLWYGWYGQKLYSDWVRTNTRDLYWIASHFRYSSVLPTMEAYKEASESVKNLSEWQPICFDDNGEPSLIFHPSMMDPQDFLIKEEKTDRKWSTIAKFDYRPEHTTTNAIHFHKNKKYVM